MQRQKKRTVGLLVLILAVILSFGLAACTQKEKAQYTVSFQTNCDAAAQDQIYTEGESFTLPSPYNFGYQLVGWFYDEACTQQVEATNNVAPSLDIDSDATLYAKWAPGEYSIVFDTGTGQAIDSIPIRMGETVNLPQPSPVQIGENSYPFAYWKYTAEGANYTDSFTLTYPEDVYLTAVYDYGVSSAFKVDEEGRYTLASNSRAVTEIDGLSMAYGTYEADITFESFSATGCGLVWNTELGDVDPAWETGVSYYYMHINATSGAMQIAYLTDAGSYVSLKIVTLAENKTGFAEKYIAARDGGGDNVFHIKVETTAESIRCYIDDELQMEVNSNTANYAIMSGTGVGVRAAAMGICFSNLKVTPSAYQITFDHAGGEGEEFIRVTSGETVPTLPTPSRAGYEFKGWADENGDAYEAGGTLTENITLTAQWEKLDHGALIYFDSGEGEQSVIYRANGEAVGEFPSAERLGFVIEGWYNGTEKVEADDVFAETDYNGETKEIVLTAKWIKDSSVEVTDGLTLETLKGSYTLDEEYDGYTAWYAGIGSYGIFDQTLTEGRISMYFKAGNYGANGFVFGASIADDFADVVNNEYKAVGSSYYYFHINNGSGIWQLVKVTDPTNPDTTNAGYDILATATLANYQPGGRYLFTFELQNVEGGRKITVWINGTQVAAYSDTQNAGGAALTGSSFGFRNGDGGCCYYGILVTDASEMDGYTVTLDANGGTCEAATVSRPDGWSLTLPEADKDGALFFGWTKMKDDVTTLVKETTMTSELDGVTLYAYFVGENETLVYLDAADGTLSTGTVLAQRNVALENDFELPTRAGYEFSGWYDENDTKIGKGSILTQASVTLTAKWTPAVENPLKANDPAFGNITIGTDGYYDIVSASAQMLTVLDGSLNEGEFSVWVTLEGSGRNGIFFGGTNLSSIGAFRDVFKGSYYYWYINNASGGWILYKGMNNPSASNTNDWGNLNDKSGTPTAWATAYGSAFQQGTYLLTVTLQRLDEGLRIVLKVDGKVFMDYIDQDSPCTGSDLGLFIQVDGRVSWFGMNAVDKSELAKGTITLDAGEGTCGQTSLTQPFGWYVTIPASRLDGNNFLGWATSEGGEAVYQPGTIVMSTELAGKTLYAVYTDKALITFVTKVGTAPDVQTVSLGELAQAPEAMSAPGYTFLGWFDEEDVELTQGYSITGNVTAIAKWGAAVTGDLATAANVYTNEKAYLGQENNGVYDVYTVNGPSIVKFSETLASGTMSMYVTYNSTSKLGGILFGASGLENLTGSATTLANANYYYWYVNASSGGWILYKVVNGSGTKNNINDLVGCGTSWAAVYGSDFVRGTYLFEVSLEKTEEGLVITLSVDGHQFLTYTDADPLTGTQTGYLNNSDATSTSFYAISVVEATAAEAAAANMENVVATEPKRQ